MSENRIKIVILMNQRQSLLKIFIMQIQTRLPFVSLLLVWLIYQLVTNHLTLHYENQTHSLKLSKMERSFH